MQYKILLKNFIHTIFVSTFALIVIFIIMAKMHFVFGSIIILTFLLAWKMISGLANINFYILYSLFLSSLVFSWNFKMLPVVMFFALMTLLFYFRVIDIRPEIKNNIPLFLTFKQFFLFLVFFCNVLALYCLFYLNHLPFWFVFSLFILISIVFFSWYKRLNKIEWSLYEKIVLFLMFLQISWFLFNFSNGFFVFPLLIVFWFYILIEIYKGIVNWSWSKTLNFIVLPIIITLVFSFLIKL